MLKHRDRAFDMGLQKRVAVFVFEMAEFLDLVIGQPADNGGDHGHEDNQFDSNRKVLHRPSL